MESATNLVRIALQNAQSEYNVSLGRLDDKLTDELASNIKLARLIANKLLDLGVKFPDPNKDNLRPGSNADAFNHRTGQG